MLQGTLVLLKTREVAAFSLPERVPAACNGWPEQGRFILSIHRDLLNKTTLEGENVVVTHLPIFNHGLSFVFKPWLQLRMHAGSNSNHPDMDH